MTTKQTRELNDIARRMNAAVTGTGMGFAPCGVGTVARLVAGTFQLVAVVTCVLWALAHV